MMTPAQQHRHALEAAARLHDAIGNLPTAAQAIRDAQPGYPTNTAGTGTRTTGHPAGLDRFVTTSDPAAHAARRLDQILRSLIAQTTELQSICATWSTDIGPEGQPRLERRASGGDCLACNRYCSGAHDDRLRSGLCVACYHHHRRWSIEHNTADRGEWMLARRRELATNTEDDAA